MIHYFVPARKGSKGFPFKNRNLIHHLDEDLKQLVEVCTDDEHISKYCQDTGIKTSNRPDHLSGDTASVKDLISWWSEGLPEEDIVCVLYLTYPERTYKEVSEFLEYFKSRTCRSMLCRKEVCQSPFLMLLDKGEGKGEQLVKHDYYRRQDYPPCFEISHYICAFKVGEIKNLNSNLYNEDTVFYSIQNKVDVDYEKDLKRYVNKSNS